MSKLEIATQVAGALGFFLGGGSLILGVKNYQRLRNAPSEEEQRSERNGLREKLFAVRRDLEDACKAIQDGDDLEGPYPESLRTLEAALPRYQRILHVPSGRALNHLRQMLPTTATWWEMIVRHVEDSKREDPIFADPQGRKRAAIERDATDGFQAVLRIIDDLINTINEANKPGS